VVLTRGGGEDFDDQSCIGIGKRINYVGFHCIQLFIQWWRDSGLKKLVIVIEVGGIRFFQNYLKLKA